MKSRSSRSKRLSPENPDRFPIPAETARRLAVLIGRDPLPAQCATELGELLAVHLRAAHAERTRESKMGSQPHPEPLRLTGPFLRRIFERHAGQGFNTRGNLRSFAFVALSAAGIVSSSIDGKHLDRLDEYLDAEPQLPLD